MTIDPVNHTCPPRRSTRGFTLGELVTLVGVLAIVTAVTVPSAAAVHGRAATSAAGRQLSSVLRRAQATAQNSEHRTRVTLDGAAGYVVSEQTSLGWAVVERGAAGAVTCKTSYPGTIIEFSARGWPCASSSPEPLAGTIVLSWGLHQTLVVLQLTGAIRCQ